MSKEVMFWAGFILVIAVGYLFFKGEGIRLLYQLLS